MSLETIEEIRMILILRPTTNVFSPATFGARHVNAAASDRKYVPEHFNVDLIDSISGYALCREII